MPDATEQSPRSDARANRVRLLEAAAELLGSDPDCTIDEIAAAAGLSRATVYRHFTDRPALVQAARSHSGIAGDSNDRDALRPAGELTRAGAVPLDVVDVLNKVPPYLLGEQIVAEAQRLAGVRSVAIYLVDIDGTRIRRLAGSQEFPEEFPLDLAVGPEIPREAIPPLRERLALDLPASVIAPMFLRGRAVGLLMAIDAPEASLIELARQAAAAIGLADSYTDVFDTARRRKTISAASEIQQNLLPPRIARISGGLLAGNVLPGYEIGGDWFDYVENPDGAWITVADSAGSGTNAAAIGAVTLGAFRAKRRRGGTLAETVEYMDVTLRELAMPNPTCSAIVARWHGPSGSLFWIACGDQQPFLITADGQVDKLPGTTHPSLGLNDSPLQGVKADAHRIATDERVLLISDGVLNRKRHDGAILGLEAVREAVATLTQPTAPELIRALERQLNDASDDPLEDDATIVAFAPTPG